MCAPDGRHVHAPRRPMVLRLRITHMECRVAVQDNAGASFLVVKEVEVFCLQDAM